jgi:hypothetical protein
VEAPQYSGHALLCSALALQLSQAMAPCPQTGRMQLLWNNEHFALRDHK